MCNWVWTVMMLVRATGLCDWRYICAKNVICRLVHQYQWLSAFGPWLALWDTPAGRNMTPIQTKSNTSYCQACSLCSSFMHIPFASHTHTHTEARMRHTQNWLMVLFGAVATMYWLTCALHVEGLGNQCCFFESTVAARVPPNTDFSVTYCMAPHECWWWREWL